MIINAFTVRNKLSSMRNNLTSLLSDLSSRLDSQDVALRSLSSSLAAMSLLLAVILLCAILLATRLKQSIEGSVPKERQLGDQELVGKTQQSTNHASAAARTSRVQSAQMAFTKFDKDKSGTIDRDELRLMLAEWGLSDVDEELLSSFDTDGNGTYRFAEFVNLFNELAPESEAGIEYNVAI